MGEIMKKWFNSLSKKSKNIYFFLFSLVVVGIISGSLFYVCLSDSDKVIVMTDINQYFVSVNNGKINNFNIMKNALIFNGAWVILIYVLGISIIGSPIICFINYIKGFVLGFSLSAIFIKYKIMGVFVGLAYVFPHVIFNILALIFLSFLALQFSYILTTNMFNGKTYNYKIMFKKYTKITGLILVMMVISSFFEAFITPTLVKLFTIFVK